MGTIILILGIVLPVLTVVIAIFPKVFHKDKAIKCCEENIEYSRNGIVVIKHDNASKKVNASIEGAISVIEKNGSTVEMVVGDFCRQVNK